MLKHDQMVKALEEQARQALIVLLEQVPAIRVLRVEQEPNGHDQGADIVATVDVQGKERVLVCEVKSSGQPRHVRMGLLQLRNYMAHQAQPATAIFIAPYLSPAAQSQCKENGVGFLDLVGNARLIFDTVFIERQVAIKPTTEKREIRSLFKPKSAQVLRVLLRDPQHKWRVTDLADAAAVSLGHISNVRAGLLDREWAQVAADGMFLSAPDALLDAWRDAYEPPVGRCLTFYTTLHGRAFEEAARREGRADGERGLVALASFSASQWLAPYGRTGIHSFYADELGLKELQSALKLSTIKKGENVVVNVLDDLGPLRDTVEPAPGIICTSPIQTYLDLAISGERGREAADHLRQEKLTWQK